MPDERYTFDLNVEHPNVDIDTMRRAVLAAIDDLRSAEAGVEDAYFLTDLLFTLLDSAFEATQTGASQRGQLQARIGALETSLSNLLGRLETLLPPPNAPPGGAP